MHGLYILVKPGLCCCLSSCCTHHDRYGGDKVVNTRPDLYCPKVQTNVQGGAAGLYSCTAGLTAVRPRPVCSACSALLLKSQNIQPCNFPPRYALCSVITHVPGGT